MDEQESDNRGIELDEMLTLAVGSGAFYQIYEGTLVTVIKHCLKHNAFVAKELTYKIYREGDKKALVEIKSNEIGF